MRPAAELPNVARANRALAGLWRTGALPRPVLEEPVLEAAALRGANRDAFGEEAEWRTPFRLLLNSLREEADLNPLGLAMAHGQIVMALRARIRAVRLWREHPEILRRPIVRPIVILGQMRSGTTRLQRLLACDERFAHTRMFESLIPVPQRGRKLRARAGLAALRLFNPAIHAIHPTAPNAAEEEFGLFSFSFGSAQVEAQWRVPGFARWWEAADAGFLYREFRALLETIAWHRGDPADRPWILKAPQFMQDLPALLEAFPDARLICLNRDLAQVVPSSASLVWNQMRIQSDSVDPAAVGAECLRKTLLRRDAAAAARAARPDVPQLEVDYAAMDRDWEGEMARIYGFLGLELTGAVRARMAAYLAGASAHLGHRYSLDQFGLARSGPDGVGLA